MATTRAKQDDTFKIPKGVQTACRRGLKLYREGFGGKGVVERTIDNAEHMAHARPTSAHQAKRMSQWFARHHVDKRPNWHRPPTAGYVAWLLWGGDAGMRWANGIVRRCHNKENKT
jgi:hypothetical protein